MDTIRLMLRNSFIAGLVLLLVGAMPMPVFAEDGSNGYGNANTMNQTQTPSNGTSAPTGAASGTYVFNQSTGLWENDYYTYNPSTKETVPKTPLEYTYNNVTGMWETEVWQYVTSEGAYSKRPVYVTAPPAGAITHGGPTEVPEQPVVADPAQPVTSDSQQKSTSPTTTSASSTQSDQSPTNAPSFSNNNNGTGGSLTFANSGTITNFLDSTAHSGDAIVIANTTAGNTATGDASAMANIINLLQSQSAIGGSGMATFTANIQGNVQGDFLIDPTQYMQPAGVSPNQLTNLTVNTKNEGTINNNINLDAASGTAQASKNTTVGNVTSGDASAIANVVNMINSVVAANQSFMGVVNIYGDYTGNILMPTESLNALLASAGPNDVAGSTAIATDVTNTSSQNINNDINLAAVSGNASASQNTSAGSVTSGNGLTNLTLLNLTGRQVVAANSLLVFVNVLGNWVGLIMDAPAGTTSAALGGGLAENTQAALASQTDINNSETFGINNTITANAKTGNAAATQNTTVGNVQSGNATASANIANIIGSQFSLSNWFGVLFINVFGTWRGNFGVAKPPVVPPITSGVATGGRGGDSAVKDMRVFTFTPRTGASTSNAGSSDNLQLSPLSEAQQSGTMSSGELLKKVNKVLSSSTGKNIAQNNLTSADAAEFNWSGLMLAIGMAGFGLVGIDRVRSNLRNRKMIVRR